MSTLNTCHAWIIPSSVRHMLERCADQREPHARACAGPPEEPLVRMSTPENPADSIDKNEKAGQRHVSARHNPWVAPPGPHPREQSGFLVRLERKLRRSDDSAASPPPRGSTFRLDGAPRSAPPRSPQRAEHNLTSRQDAVPADKHESAGGARSVEDELKRNLARPVHTLAVALALLALSAGHAQAHGSGPDPAGHRDACRAGGRARPAALLGALCTGPPV